MNARSKLSAAFWMHGGTDKESGPLLDAFADEVRTEQAAQLEQARSLAVRFENETTRLADEVGNLRRELNAARNEQRAVIDAVAAFGIYSGNAKVSTDALVKRADELVTENARLTDRVAELEKEAACQSVASLNGARCSMPARHGGDHRTDDKRQTWSDEYATEAAS